jgi:3-hydroxymyristoyl/3-hydroxydecanoyl-(acyl carrier protein) dehydratase
VTTTIQVCDILKYIPHRPPMVWVDEVVRFSKVDGECLIHIRADGLYMSPMGLRSSSCLEFIAQAYGFISTCYITRVLDPNAGPMKRAMLVSFKDARFASPEILASVRAGDTLRVPVEGVRAVGPITAFYGRVFRGETLLCEVQMRTFCE